MIRVGTLLILIIAFQGVAFGQGLLDSVLGPGGLGIWGGNSGSQFNPQAQYGAPQMPQQPYQQPGQAMPGQPQGYQPYYNQQGVYSDWHTQQPAMQAPQEQYGMPQETVTEQQYGGQPQYQQYPQQPYQQQYAAPQQQQYAPPAQPAQRRGQPLRPGQYAPDRNPAAPGPITADDLPSGAVRITTTTPDGTTIQYYPPTGEVDEAPQVRPRPRRQAPKPARERQIQQQTDQTSTVQQGNIAMPRPVQIPQGQDPRQGWGSAVDRAPSPR
ncbi:hypothetical protein [Desulfomonile tiedjei]|uniref:Uncharacterized protein n=1 Tax=Desulfomonile tiedjei (strain ATCC 49306 / DSM 6799 / DCB-1) TaxID=706587 RepID=I4C897_DESTA|nr:hypothetical protein [Desulfomonile tiedjei]AFM25788.1 hypothetical protein Desti_3126 [Desulfomonile tiedjei DSM 6799]